MTEAKMSGNIRGYYRGYSIQITNRDPDVEVKPLLQKMVQIAKFMESHDFEPSWNSDTNKKAEGEQPALSGTCEKHNAPLREYTSKKTGKPYFGHYVKDQGMCFGK